jgi:hypothetical protein
MTTQKILLDRLLYVHYQHHNLSTSKEFLEDFGLIPIEESDGLVYYRGFGENPYVYIAEKSPDQSRHFIGGGWAVRSLADLEVATNLPNSSPIQASTAPGGGLFVDVKDPNGINVRLLHGVQTRAISDRERPASVHFNSWEKKPRKGNFQRFDSGPSRIYKLGHYGLVVDKTQFDLTVKWYLENFSLAETDSLYEGESGKNMMTFMHIDKGETFTDHHVGSVCLFYLNVIVKLSHDSSSH